MDNHLTLQFSDAQAADVALTGGKGSSLAKLSQASILVPYGFVVTTNALNQFLEENRLSQQIKDQITRLAIDDEAAIRATSENIKKSILGASINIKLEKSVSALFRELSLSLVAVRSSATSEDSDKDSWAGELETYLNTTEQTLFRNIKKCWASLFSERAITYRLEKNMQEKDISVAVVVQQMIQSDVSGVCFTVHPVSGQKNIMLIEAVWGLGEAIVSGQVTPDSYSYDKQFNVVLRTSIVEQTKKLALSDKKEGIEWVTVSQAESSKQKLEYKQIQSLASICERVEAYYRTPQDIEWAVKDEHVFIVQSRPITTLD